MSYYRGYRATSVLPINLVNLTTGANKCVGNVIECWGGSRDGGHVTLLRGYCDGKLKLVFGCGRTWINDMDKTVTLRHDQNLGHMGDWHVVGEWALTKEGLAEAKAAAGKNSVAGAVLK